jgi:hypothetical protein
MAAGIVLTVLAMLILLPYQDIGWGYRYVHGLIGSAALLAAFLWGKLTAELELGKRLAAWSVMAAGTAVALLVLLPIHLWQMHAYLSPYTRSNAAVADAKTEAVVIETISMHHGIELVRNDPYLRNRPLTFDIGALDDNMARELCSKMSVSVFGGEAAKELGVMYVDPRPHPEYQRLRKLRAFLESDECRGLRRPG